MIIDAHHHLWHAAYPWLNDPSLTAIRRDYVVDDLRPHLSAAGVDATVLVEAGLCDLSETRDFLAIAQTSPEIVGVVGWASLTDESLPATLAWLRAGLGGRLLVGIRDQVQAVTDPAYLAAPSVRGALATIGAAGLTFDLVVRRDQLGACAEAAAATPGTTFVLDHLGKPALTPDGLREWRAAVAPLAACPNVVAKLSGLTTEAGPQWTFADLEPFVDAALSLFGPDRLMAGSDWPVCELHATYESAWSAVASCLAPLSTDERAAVEGGTAIRTYRLEIKE